MEPMLLRPMEPEDRTEVAELICVSINYWYQLHGMPKIFTGGPDATTIFFDVYESLDPGCGVVAQNERTERLMGSCFFHPRQHHVSLGIMNVHP
ncbi:MAG: N-acetyltransferase, partial [Planctomycetota bacterium]